MSEINYCCTCKYFQEHIFFVLGATHFHGVCTWFNHNEYDRLPVWATIEIKYGSLSPKQTGCVVWERAN